MRFDSSAPSESAVRAELRQRVGPAYADLDSYEVRGNVVDITTDMNPVSGPYVVKILLELGGVYLDFTTRQPCQASLPSYVNRPWVELPWWKRAAIYVGFHLGILSTALPIRPLKR